MSSEKENEKLVGKAVEFQPDALEIKHEKLPFWARYSVILIFLFFAGVITWACVSEVDMIVTGTGKLVTNSPSVVIKPLERSVIKSIDVKVGDVVKKEQVLISFDPSMNMADTERLNSEISTLSAQFQRLLCEFKQEPYVVTDPGSEDQQWQRAIFKQRSQAYQEKLNYYDQSVKRIEAEMEANRDSLRKQDERLEAVKRIEGIYTELLEKKAISLTETLQIQITRMEMEAEVDKLRNSLVEQEHEMQTIIASRNSYVEEWRNDVSVELVKVQRELTNNQKSFDKVARLNAYDVLRSPCDAVVHEIAAFSVGSAVREAEALITLVPLDSILEVELEIPAQDIGRVQPGSEVRIKLNPFPFQKHGTLGGVVRTISEDTFQRQAGEPGMPGAYYRARVRIIDPSALRNVKEGFRLIPGMEVQGEVKVGHRRIIEYIIHPLIKSLDVAIREP